MTKYKLVKPLPRFEVGDEFHTSPKGNLAHTKTGALAYTKGELKKFPNILEDWFEKVPDEPKVELSGQYIPQETNGGIGTIFTVAFKGEPDYISNLMLRRIKELAAIGISFETEEECYECIDKMKAYQILRRDTRGFEPDWYNILQHKYDVYYDYVNCKLSVCTYSICSSHQSLWFATKEDAEASIKTHEKEWKIYLGVEE